MSKLYPSFSTMLEVMHFMMRDQSHEVHTETWQGIDIKKRPEARMREVLHVDFKVPMTVGDSTIGLQSLQDQIRPNLPWADEHFEERICGYPMNPGESWKRWPWANSANEFRDAKGRFEINYMERFWAAGEFDDTPEEGVRTALTGIRGRRYGDLRSILNIFEREPLTRQAWMPIYFPEDTGAGGRVPCSLGYHWMMRGGYLNVFYPIRSCDYFRHFRDDIYLAVRLCMWLRDQLATRAPDPWAKVKLGYFSMWIGSLHTFINDYRRLFEGAGS